MGIIVNSAPRLFAEAVTQGNLKLFALVLDMCIPPLAFLLLLVSTLFAMSGAFWWITGAAAPFWLAASALAMLVSGVLLSWVRYGRHVISAGSLMRVPLYVLWKVPLYLKFLVRRHTAWVRTKRDGE